MKQIQRQNLEDKLDQIISMLKNMPEYVTDAGRLEAIEQSERVTAETESPETGKDGNTNKN